ncbi:MAG: GTPase Era [Calditrichia bacterium]
MNERKAVFKAGYISIIGKPNAGKSTLLNRILGEKLSIVTHKPQTTRKNVLGILNKPGVQMIFLDTPGVIKPHYKLQEIMMTYVKSAIKDADIILLMLDVTRAEDIESFNEEMASLDKPVILVLNKIDAIAKNDLLPIMDVCMKLYKYEEIIPISALAGDGIDRVLSALEKHLPEHPPYFPEDYLTDQPERFFVAELIREKIFLMFGEEIPYSTHVEIEQFKEREKGKYYIQATIYVERPTQKKIIIGRRGEKIRELGKVAREEIEQFLQHEVYLELFVKVVEKWRKKDGRLRSLGYE